MSTNNNIANAYAIIAKATPATEDIKHYVQATRGLTDQQIADHVIAPITDDIIDRLLSSGEIHPADAAGVPGFYGNFVTGDIAFRSQRNVHFAILNRDADGNINAIMTRYKAGKDRYGWYSSKNLSGGVTSGAPMGVVRGQGSGDNQAMHIAVCEGFFKACAIARTMPVDYVIHANGVQCSADLSRNIRTLSNGSLVSIVMVPDTDCWDNPAVMRATVKMIRMALGQTQNVQAAAWPIHCGKGYDDVLHNGQIEKIRIKSVEQFLYAARKWALSRNDNGLVDQIDYIKLGGYQYD